jgi:DNA-binding MarR family transcriptional regulator
MTPRIARMIDAGWVRREPLDGRSSALALTSAGIELRDQAWAIMKDHEERLIRRVGEHRSEAFLSSIHDLWNTSPTAQP